MECVSLVCENNSNEAYNVSKKIIHTKLYSNEYFTLLGFTVSAKGWQSVSGTERFAQIVVPEITDKIVENGTVIIYLNESSKYVSLPFKYYQHKNVLLFQPSYEKGHAYISILGNFILNVSSSFRFEILILNKKGQLHYKKLNLYNYCILQSVLNGDVG